MPQSAAAFQCFFASSSNYALADPSVEFYRHVQDELGVDLKMRWCGYLCCFTEEEDNQEQSVLKALLPINPAFGSKTSLNMSPKVFTADCSSKSVILDSRIDGLNPKSLFSDFSLAH